MDLQPLELGDLLWFVDADDKVSGFLTGTEGARDTVAANIEAATGMLTDKAPRAFFTGFGGEIAVPFFKVSMFATDILFKTEEGSLAAQPMSYSSFGMGMGMRIQGALFVGTVVASDDEVVTLRDLDIAQFQGVSPPVKLCPPWLAGSVHWALSRMGPDLDLLIGSVGFGPNAPIGLYAETADLKIDATAVPRLLRVDTIE